MKQQQARATVPRRVVAKGAAWSVPAIAIGSSAPSAAASDGGGGAACAVSVVGAGVKQVQGKTVTVTFTVTNGSGAVQPVAILSIVGPANANWSTPDPSSWQAPAGTSTQDVVLKRGNNASGQAVVTLQVCGRQAVVTVDITK